MENYYEDGRFYYYRPYKGEWKVAKLEDKRFQITAGLTVPLEDLVEQCGVENVIKIPLPEEL